MNFRFILKNLFIYFLLLVFSCERSTIRDSINMDWKVIESIQNDIILYEGKNLDVPLRAWVVQIPIENNHIKVLVSKDSDGVSTPSEMSSASAASVVINGGYFTRGQKPVRHIGLLKLDDELYEPASNSVLRDNMRYNINRGALGIFHDKSVDIAWASTKNDSIFSWSFPFNNRPGMPANVNYNFSKYWNVKEAVHAGPVLILNGKINVTSEQDFFNTPVDGVQPRSAIGYNKNGDIIMMVIDGRQVDSRGAYLKEVALLMRQFNCYEALNLDGGGSSSLVVNGKLINNPIGLKSEREVMSFIAAIPD